MIKKLLNKKFNRNNKKGFTLAELLIVVAIIGVLVAVSIPIFTSQLEKSRDSASIANIRSAYAEASAALLTEDDSAANVTITKTNGAVTKISVANVAIQTAQANSWSGNASNLTFTIDDPGNLATKSNKTVEFTVSATTGQITGAAFANS
ncbi:MAG: prepilin-type N-terminal cleavage/methylation domain-containing protein [Butyrivibrio sp.]|nr:prepilin-type N-terminal cleavage/methylation domain-containing protein [Butyrivibrio sp.]